ncbi:MAG TPA: hypothetical protein VNP03_11080 [Pseudonocardia sp.]|nr:hypothetical protein [Pseudonocardia sp.]
MTMWEMVAAAAVVVALLVITVVIWRRRARLSDFGRSESVAWTEWQRTAETLSMRDRWTVYWACLAGRAVPDRRLAEAAVQRADAGAMQLEPSRWRPLVIVFPAVLLCFGVLQVALTERWVHGLLFALWGVSTAFTMLLFGWSRRLVQRAAEANRQLSGSG